MKTLPNRVFTSFDIAAETNELKTIIGDSRVNNIYQLDPNTVLLKLHKTDTPPLLLLLEAGKRFHLTAYAQEKPGSPPAFCMALRKTLRNAWLRSLEHYEFERIIALTFDTQAGKQHLILELFGEGNLILINGKREILQALIFKRMRDRNIVRGEVYSFPPSSGRNPFKTSREELAEELRKAGDAEVVRILARGLSMGGIYAEEILVRAGIDKSKSCSKVTEPEIEALHMIMQDLLCNLTAMKFEPGIVLSKDGGYLDVVPFQLRRYEGCEVRPVKTFNEALDQFYLSITVAEKATREQGKVVELKRQAEKLKRILDEQGQTIREAETMVDQEKRVGDTIYENSVKIQELLDSFNNARAAGKDLTSLLSETRAAEESVMNQIVVERFDSRDFAINIWVEKMHFNLNLRKSLFENAAEYYERSKKAKQKAIGAKAALTESLQKLRVVEEKIHAEEATKLLPVEMLKQMEKRRVEGEGREWFEKFRWFKSSEGLLVVAGKDAVSNEVLVKKHVERSDLVFHADVVGAPFVVVKTDGKTPSDQTLFEAGEFAAAFSRGWREGMGSVDVYWVKPDQLSKMGPSGEYVSHGAFAVTGKRNWMRGVALRTAVGVVEDNRTCFIGGPVEAVKARARIYVTLVPGDVIGKEILKQILHTIAITLPKEQRERIVEASIEEIREYVPYTKGQITKNS